jgi:hypothetical protein
MAGERGRVRAEFLEDVDRYAEAEGQIYPVLLTSFRSGSNYEEDMQDAEEYPPEWRWRFYNDLKEAGAAALASDANSDGVWRFLAIHRISEVQLTNFLSCKIGKRLAALKFE